MQGLNFILLLESIILCKIYYVDNYVIWKIIFPSLELIGLP